MTSGALSLLAIGPVWDGNEVWLMVTGGLLVLSFPTGLRGRLQRVLPGADVRAVAADGAGTGPGVARQRTESAVAHGGRCDLFGLQLPPGAPLRRGGGQYCQRGAAEPAGVLSGAVFLDAQPVCAAGRPAGAWSPGHSRRQLADLKTEGPVQERARLAASRLFPVLVVLIVLVTIATFLARGAMGINYHNHPIWLIAPLATVAVLGAHWRFRATNADLPAFISSAVLIVTLLVSTAIGLYPYLLPSSPHPARSLTIHNAYSSHFAMQVGLTWVIIGFILVAAHTSWVYYLFRGKVSLEGSTHY